MGVLMRPRVLAAALLLCAALGSFSARAEVPPLVSGVEGTLNGEAGWGQVYSAGTSLQISLGSADDPSNRSGDLHADFTNQFSPLDPSDPNSALKHTFNWSGGGSVSTWSKGTFGLDLDSIIDPSELLNTDGFKFILGHDAYKASYRYARNVVSGSFVAGAPPKQFNAQGAYFAQQTFGFEASFDLTEDDNLAPEIAYSLFSPNAPEFANLLNQANLASIASFQDTLQSLEQWSIGATFKHELGTHWDFTVTGRLAHLIIPGIASYESTLAVGLKPVEPLHVQIAWNYTYETNILVQNVIQLELKFSWEHKSKAEEEEEEEAEAVQRKAPSSKLPRNPSPLGSPPPGTQNGTAQPVGASHGPAGDQEKGDGG